MKKICPGSVANDNVFVVSSDPFVKFTLDVWGDSWWLLIEHNIILSLKIKKKLNIDILNYSSFIIDIFLSTQFIWCRNCKVQKRKVLKILSRSSQRVCKRQEEGRSVSER
jgi:hypothetical protein